MGHCNVTDILHVNGITTANGGAPAAGLTNKYLP
jgi:hypothetical protein